MPRSRCVFRLDAREKADSRTRVAGDKSKVLNNVVSRLKEREIESMLLASMG